MQANETNQPTKSQAYIDQQVGNDRLVVLHGRACAPNLVHARLEQQRISITAL